MSEQLRSERKPVGGNYCETSVLHTESIGMLIGIGKPAGYRFEVVNESGGHSRISAAAGLFVFGRCDQEQTRPERRWSCLVGRLEPAVDGEVKR